MKTKDFTITYIGLKLGSHEFNYDLNDTFFELFEFSDYSDLKGVAQMKMLKSETVLDLDFSFSGSITAPCDVTNEPYTQKLENSFSMQVKFGEEYNDENDELLILPHGEHSFNIAQYMYELVVLSETKEYLMAFIEASSGAPEIPNQSGCITIAKLTNNKSTLPIYPIENPRALARSCCSG